MAQDTEQGAWLTPTQIAEELLIDAGKVTHWLNSQQLRGVDVAEGCGKKRRWRIKREWLDEFLQSRSNVLLKSKSRSPVSRKPS